MTSFTSFTGLSSTRRSQSSSPEKSDKDYQRQRTLSHSSLLSLPTPEYIPIYHRSVTPENVNVIQLEPPRPKRLRPSEMAVRRSTRERTKKVVCSGCEGKGECSMAGHKLPPRRPDTFVRKLPNNLLQINYSQDLVMNFKNLAAENTRNRIETGGILLGKLEGRLFQVITLDVK